MPGQGRPQFAGKSERPTDRAAREGTVETFRSSETVDSGIITTVLSHTPEQDIIIEQVTWRNDGPISEGSATTDNLSFVLIVQDDEGNPTLNAPANWTVGGFDLPQPIRVPAGWTVGLEATNQSSENVDIDTALVFREVEE